MEKVHIYRLAEQDMKDFGKTINKRVKAKNHGLMEQLIEGHTKKEKSMETEFFTGEMTVRMREVFMKIKFTEKVNTYGRMEECMMEIGTITRCMVRVFSYGPMVESMMGSIIMIRRRDLAFFYLRMDVDMKESGKMESSKGEVSTRRKTLLRRVYGRTGKGLSGYRK